MGSRNVIVGPTDDKGNVKLGGGTAMGYGAQADPTSVAVGSGAMAGDIRIIDPESGELLRALTLDPTRDYQPLGQAPNSP